MVCLIKEEVADEVKIALATSRLARLRMPPWPPESIMKIISVFLPTVFAE